MKLKTIGIVGMCLALYCASGFAVSEQDMIRAERARLDRLVQNERMRQEILLQQQARQTQQGQHSQPVQDIQQAQQKAEDGTLFPGQSYTYNGVTLTWVVDNSKLTTPTLGKLQLTGPKTKMPPIDLAKAEDASLVYVDDTVLTIYKNQGNGRLRFNTYPQNHMINFGSASFKCEVRVSSVCPLFLNEWRISLSDKMVAYPDGSQYFEILGLNTKTKEEERLPATPGSMRKFGRFQISVGTIDPIFRTAIISVFADIDKTIRGADAFVESGIIPNKPAGEYLPALGKSYGFEVEWVASPEGNADSIDFAKKFQPRNASSVSDTTPKDLVQYYIGGQGGEEDLNRLAYEWKDLTHLRVWAKNYSKYLAAEAEKKKEQTQQESEKSQRDAEEKQFTAIFESKYKVETRAYPLSKISPATAKTLVDSELGDYYLSLAKVTPPFGGHLTTDAELGKNFCILFVPQREIVRGKEPGGIASAHEYAIADEKANALLVCAVPGTHVKIQKILAQADGLLAPKGEAAGPPPKRYRLEVILLQGSQQKATSSATTQSASEKPLANYSYGGRDYVVDKIESSDLSYMYIIYIEKTGTTKPLGNIQLPFVPGSMFTIRRVMPRDDKTLFIEYDISPASKPQATPSKPLSSYGLSEDDIKMFGFDRVSEVGKGIVSLLGEKGPGGKALVALNDAYSAEFEFSDVRPPYLIAKGRLLATKGAGAGKDTPNGVNYATSEKPLLENTLFLEKGKPSVLGLTNLRQALILIVRLHDAAK